jgi:S1-C subfamily serine protease
MCWKKTGLFSILLAAFAIVAYAQNNSPQRAHSTNLQMAMSPGYLGVGVQALSGERIKSLNLKESAGVEVRTVIADSPAAKAGLRVGDIILEVNGQKVEGQDQFAASIGSRPPGTKIALNIWRDGVKENIAATLGRQIIPQMPFEALVPMSPNDLQALFAGDAWKVGFEGEPLTPQLATFFGAPPGEGVLVRTVVEKSPAEKAGLKAGDVVIKVNGIPVSRPGEIAGIVRQIKKVTFAVIRNKKEIALNLELARNNNPFEPEADN